jgi:hypothetical protein
MAAVFQRFAWVAVAMGVLMLGAGVLSAHRSGWSRTSNAVRAGLTLVAWLIAWWLLIVVFPSVLAARAGAPSGAFEALHSGAGRAFTFQGLLLLAAAAVPYCRELPAALLERIRRPAARPEPEQPSPAAPPPTEA